MNHPLSLNKWMYTEGNPVNLTDPSGKFPTWCQSMPNKGLYELCVLKSYDLEPISYFELGKKVRGEKGCYSGPEDYRAQRAVSSPMTRRAPDRSWCAFWRLNVDTGR